jgi:hypothetical protein
VERRGVARRSRRARLPVHLSLDRPVGLRSGRQGRRRRRLALRRVAGDTTLGRPSGLRVPEFHRGSLPVPPGSRGLLAALCLPSDG